MTIVSRLLGKVCGVYFRLISFSQHTSLSLLFCTTSRSHLVRSHLAIHITFLRATLTVYHDRYLFEILYGKPRKYDSPLPWPVVKKMIAASHKNRRRLPEGTWYPPLLY